MKKTITRKYLLIQISKLLNNEISIKDFGDEMFHYLAFDDDYTYETGHEGLIKDILNKFSDMHDADKDNSGYIPDIPSKEKLIELRDLLNS